LATVVGAAALFLMTGLPGRLNERARLLASGHDDRPATIDSCIADRADLLSCPLGASGPPTFAVWGDSHAAALGEAVGLVAKREARSGLLYAFNACPPGAPGDNPALGYGDRKRCSKRGQLIEAQILSSSQITTVILIAYWQSYLSVDAPSFLNGLTTTVARLRAADKQVILLGNLPIPPYDVPLATALAEQFGRSIHTSYSPPRLDTRLAAVAYRTGSRMISLAPILCPGGRCQAARAGHPIFFDNNHVTQFANRQLVAPGLERDGLFRIMQLPARAPPSAP
jgi:hypothetical protein